MTATFRFPRKAVWLDGYAFGVQALFLHYDCFGFAKQIVTWWQETTTTHKTLAPDLGRMGDLTDLPDVSWLPSNPSPASCKS